MINPFADFLAMRRNIVAYSRIMAVWGAVLHIPPLLGALFYIQTIEGAVVAGAVVLSLLVAGQINKRQPMSKLLSICHVFFLPAIVILSLAMLDLPDSLIFNIWAIYSLVVMAASMVMDIANLWQYYFSNNRHFIKDDI
tara:strand:+ start:58 stop:474 length:417 start_codon:yes stop_codon:yes gene_type:complete